MLARTIKWGGWAGLRVGMGDLSGVMHVVRGWPLQAQRPCCARPLQALPSCQLVAVVHPASSGVPPWPACAAGQPAKLVSVHAGLEAGSIVARLPGATAVSIGPNVRDVHTPQERLEVRPQLLCAALAPRCVPEHRLPATACCRGTWESMPALLLPPAGGQRGAAL